MVSIITPCYNSAAHISETIQSVLNQTYKDWEMIIVDDGSEDESPEIISKYQNQDSRIKYFRTDSPSGSPSLPRNIGLDKAEGEVIAFLDSDDIWLPNKLEKQIELLEKSGCKIVYSDYEKIDFWGNRENRIIKVLKKTTYDDLLKWSSIPFLTSLASKSAIGSVRFKEIAQEDYCFWLDVLSQGFEAINTGEVMAQYRESKGSRSSNKLMMLKGHWKIIKHEQKNNLLKSIYCMLTYGYEGMRKYIK